MKILVFCLTSDVKVGTNIHSVVKLHSREHNLYFQIIPEHP